MIKIFRGNNAYKWTRRERVLLTVLRIFMSIPLAAQPSFGPVGLRRVVILISINN